MKMKQDLMVFFLEIIYLNRIPLNTIPLKKIKDRTYIIILDEYANVGTHWIALFYKKNEVVYFDRFGVEYIPEEIKDFTEEFPRNKNIKTNIFRIQEDHSIMCGYFLHRIY